MQRGLQFSNFTITKPNYPEALPQKLVVDKTLNALSVFPDVYFGLWGSVYNSVMDTPPSSIYELLE